MHSKAFTPCTRQPCLLHVQHPPPPKACTHCMTSRELAGSKVGDPGHSRPSRPWVISPPNSSLTTGMERPVRDEVMPMGPRWLGVRV